MSRNRSINLTEAILLRGHVFKATLEAALKGLGAQQVTFEGFERPKVTALDSYLHSQRVLIQARWLEDGQQRQCSYSVDWHQFDSYMLDSDLRAAKHWAISIAREMVYERINDVLKRATMSVPLSHF